MTTVDTIRVSSNWLELREPADAASRSRELVRQLRSRLPDRGLLVVHDIGCGSGSMGRWLAPQLPGRQCWILHDRDPELLAVAEANMPVSVETRLDDVTRLARDELGGASLITASALLDLLTADELERLVGACTGAGCPLLLTLSVTGRVQLLPVDPLDARIAASFDEHQRRVTSRGPLLGPDAVDAAVEAFRALGAEVVVKPSPWRLGADDSRLAAEWFAGWIGAACEHDPGLAADADLYVRRRLREAKAGRLAVTVGHADLLVLP